MENFYFLFEDLDYWDIWDEKGYTIGFLILLFSTFIYLSIFYLLLGRKSMRFSSMGSWFLFGVYNLFSVFIFTLTLESFQVFDLTSFGEIHYGIWLFTIINAFYAFALYAILSLVFKRFSLFSKFIPVKF